MNELQTCKDCDVVLGTPHTRSCTVTPDDRSHELRDRIAELETERDFARSRADTAGGAVEHLRERIAELMRALAMSTPNNLVLDQAFALARARAVIEASRPYIPKSKPPKQAAEAYAAWLALAEYDRGES